MCNLVAAQSNNCIVALYCLTVASLQLSTETRAVLKIALGGLEYSRRLNSYLKMLQIINQIKSAEACIVSTTSSSGDVWVGLKL